MPELPEVETVKAALEPVLTGQTIGDITLNRHDLRFPIPDDFINTCKAQTIKSVTRRGKYILIALTNNNSAILHLGMSGRVTILPPKTQYDPQKHDHVIMHLDDGTHIIYNDPRRFGMLLLLRPQESLETHKLFKTMGPEPLGNAFNGKVLQERIGKKSCSIKSAILDQRVVCGVGNIYACEALFDSDISPDRKANSLTTNETESLTTAIKAVLQKAIKAGGSSLKDYTHTDGSLGYFQTMFSVYDQEGNPCPKCGDTIKRIVQSGRSTFFCASCQK